MPHVKHYDVSPFDGIKEEIWVSPDWSDMSSLFV